MNLYLRFLGLLLRIPFIVRRGVLEPSRARFRVWPSDCDLNFHMNNGRYLTLMDLGRAHLLAQMGFLGTIARRRWAPVLAAAEISYIRALNPLQRFTLVTRLLTWDEKYFYLEQRFESDSALCAVALVKGLFIAPQGRLAPSEMLTTLGIEMPPPTMPAVVQHWNELAALKKEHVPLG